jgi:hypothetical protein
MECRSRLVMSRFRREGQKPRSRIVRQIVIEVDTLDEATILVGMTTNKMGKARDLSVLGAVRLALKL